MFRIASKLATRSRPVSSRLISGWRGRVCPERLALLGSAGVCRADTSDDVRMVIDIRVLLVGTTNKLPMSLDFDVQVKRREFMLSVTNDLEDVVFPVDAGNRPVTLWDS